MKVSALVMTYNHARFIGQALDSVLMQDVNFAYEIIISEDCSTDGTREYVVAFQQKHPDITRLLLSEHNLHSNEIVSRGIQAARGEYIALLDGDDYWTSADKLQRQVDFLDSHPECTICFHNARAFCEDRSREPWNWTPARQKELSTLEDLWMDNFIATCSTLFRNGLIEPFPAWYDAMFPITDWPLHLLNAEHGKIGYIDEVMGAYRYHQGGLYSPLSERAKQDIMLTFYQTMNRNFEYRYDKTIRTALSTYFFEWAEEYATRGDWEQARVCFLNAWSERRFNKHIRATKLLLLGLKVFTTRS